jgi:zinc/manganese transport system substrate-binding protein
MPYAKPATIVAALILATVLAGCSSDPKTESAATSASCPTDVVRVVVSVNQWSDIVQQLGGDCADVTTVIQNGSIDPHDYEPTSSDIASFESADIAVINGLDYDPWAESALNAQSQKPLVVDAGKVAQRGPGDNPHVWYSPTYVRAVATAVTEALSTTRPNGADYFATQLASWKTAMKPYDDAIAALAATASATTYGATESVFEYMADEIGLVDKTPQGFVNAAANESEPGPADIAEFEVALRDGKMSVLIYNSQTESALTAQIKSTATNNEVPVVEVTESMPATYKSFVDWQVAQLESLKSALK